MALTLLPRSILRKPKSTQEFDSDRSLYNHATRRVRDFPDDPVGVGPNEARHWHRRAYGGLGDISTLSATELGHAAAYEAHRTWIHHPDAHASLHDDIDRKREALVGFAIAEVTRLLHYAGLHDPYFRSAASEAAAHTASRIFYETRDGHEEEYRSRPLYRGDVHDDPYYEGDEMSYPRRHRSHSRHRSRSRHPSFSNIPTTIQAPGVAYSTSMGIPGVTHSDYPRPDYGSHHGNAYAGSTRSVPIPGSTSPYPGGLAMSNTVPYPGTSMPMGISPSGYQMPMGGTSPYSTSIAAPSITHARSRSASFSYPQQATYMGHPMGAGYMGAPYTTAPQPSHTIIIQPQRKHRHKHRHRHHRSRSIDRY